MISVAADAFEAAIDRRGRRRTCLIRRGRQHHQLHLQTAQSIGQMDVF